MFFQECLQLYFKEGDFSSDRSWRIFKMTSSSLVITSSLQNERKLKFYQWKPFNCHWKMCNSVLLLTVSWNVLFSSDAKIIGGEISCYFMGKINIELCFKNVSLYISHQCRLVILCYFISLSLNTMSNFVLKTCFYQQCRLNFQYRSI